MVHDPYELTPEQAESWSKDQILAFYSRKLKELAKLNDQLGEDISSLKQEAEKDRELLKTLKAENNRLGEKYDELIARLRHYVAQEQKQKA